MAEIDKEIRIVTLMIRLYCRRKEGNETLCPNCAALIEYATERLSHCRYGDHKQACRHCPTHCYRPEMRNRIREVMRYAGPRMILYAPREFFRHYFYRK